MNPRLTELLAYFDRLIAAENSGHFCTKEMDEVIAEIRGVLIERK